MSRKQRILTLIKTKISEILNMSLFATALGLCVLIFSKSEMFVFVTICFHAILLCLLLLLIFSKGQVTLLSGGRYLRKDAFFSILLCAFGLFLASRRMGIEFNGALMLVIASFSAGYLLVFFLISVRERNKNKFAPLGILVISVFLGFSSSITIDKAFDFSPPEKVNGLVMGKSTSHLKGGISYSLQLLLDDQTSTMYDLEVDKDTFARYSGSSYDNQQIPVVHGLGFLGIPYVYRN